MYKKFIISSLLVFTFYNVNSQQWNTVATSQGNGISTIDVVNNELFISGGITSWQGSTANNLVSYDGVSWEIYNPSPLGDINKFIYFENKCYLGGGFISANGDPNIDVIATWDGTTWGGFGNEVNRHIYDFVSYNNKLFGIGNFSDLFGVTGMNDIFQFDGINFTDVEGGISGAVVSGRELEVYDDLLIAAGRIQSAGGIPVSHLAAWDGNDWTSYAGGTNAIIYSMITDTVNDYLYISGDFTFVGNSLPVSYFAKWDGETWFSYDGGINCGAFDMCMYQNQLYVGGCFDQAGGKPIGYIARYDGAQWDSLGASVNNEWGVGTLAAFEDELYVGGDFTQIGDSVVPGLAKWIYPLSLACQDMYAGIGLHPDTIYTGQLPYTFRSGSYGNGSLQWEFSDGFISNEGHTDHDFNNTPGIYDIMLTAQCGTEADTVYSQVTVLSNVGIEPEEPEEFTIYPNPANDVIHISGIFEISDEIIFELYDISGRKLMNQISSDNAGLLTIPLDHLSTGSYTYRLVNNGTEVKSDRLIIIQ